MAARVGVGGGDVAVPDRGARLYRAVAAGGDAYINHAVAEHFARFFPLSARSRCLFDDHLALIKEALKPYVQELVKSNCMLDTGRWPVGHLTCVEIEDAELPWEQG